MIKFTHISKIQLIFAILLLCIGLYSQQFIPRVFAQSPKVVTFQPTTDDIANPERGFMKQSSIWVDVPLDTTKIRALQPTDSVVWIYFRLDNYRDPRDAIGVTLSDYTGKLLEPLGSGKGLDTVKATFTTARSKGLKLVIRFIYNWGPGSNADPLKVTPDIPLSWALQHLAQVKPLLTDNADVIAAMQFGFVGHWGEWHSSKYLGSLENRKGITDAVLAALLKERMVQMRYPKYREKLYGSPITQSEAYTQSDRSRIGLNNDCFVRDDNDQGTFSSTVWSTKISTYCDYSPVGTTQCWKNYFDQTTRYTLTGGESCGQNSPISDCPSALTQMATMNWSFINNGYHPDVLNSWITQGCMPEIRRRLGYRFVLSQITLPTKVTRGSTFPVTLNIINEGFANMYNERPVFIVFENMSTGTKTPILINGLDPRRWLMQKMQSQNIISMNVSLPSSFATGIYRLYLWLPDAHTTLQNNPAYSVQFANLNIWQAATGYNLLTDNIEVTSTGLPTTTPYLTGVPGDANGDGHVTGADYAIWAAHYGQTVMSGPINGDFNSDGIVSGSDYAMWLTNYGR